MEDIKEYALRKRKIEQLCSRVRDIMLGRELPLASYVIRNDHFDVSGVEALVSSMLGKCEPTRYDQLDFISAYLETVICYLFAECNEDDQTFISIYTLLANSQAYWGIPFDDSPFGIMLADAGERDHYLIIDSEAASVLKEKASLLRTKLNELDIKKYNLSGVNKYLDEFVRCNSFSICENDDNFRYAQNELRRISFRARRQVTSTGGED